MTVRFESESTRSSWSLSGSGGKSMMGGRRDGNHLHGQTKQSTGATAKPPPTTTPVDPTPPPPPSSSSSRFLLPLHDWAHRHTMSPWVTVGPAGQMKSTAKIYPSRGAPVVVPTFKLVVNFCAKNRQLPPSLFTALKHIDKKIEELGGFDALQVLLELGNGGSPDKSRKMFDINVCSPALCLPRCLQFVASEVGGERFGCPSFKQNPEIALVAFISEASFLSFDDYVLPFVSRLLFQDLPFQSPARFGCVRRSQRKRGNFEVLVTCFTQKMGLQR
ncbi:hypothetical protein MUK42_22128 [Musa troglodytarum]|uniref:Uncharacterized protein n=1 Tax=Musa troglodytarum TaxID=320322 RepID=A0A9E7H6N4_9LILI|nr:hypothetical protein MUK42_22128 [Musa troglodytarum]